MDLEWMVNAVMLAFCSIQDIREKEVSLWKLKIYGILAAAVSIWKLFSPKDDLPVLIFRLFAGLLPGIFLLILARITREAVGYGDGLVLRRSSCSLGLIPGYGILPLWLKLQYMAVPVQWTGQATGFGKLQADFRDGETTFQFPEVKEKLPPASLILSGFLSGISDGSRVKP